MKKLLLSISFVLAFSAAQSQNLAMENFDVFPATWTITNQSAPLGTFAWQQGGGTFAPYITNSFNGGPTSMAICSFNSTTGAGTISNWLITPSISIQDGDIITFYSRTVDAQAAPTPNNTFPDRLEMRISTNGDFSVIPSTGPTDLGDFTTLALTINPTLTLTGYPSTWTQYSYTVTGVPTATDSKIAFRYWVTDGGPQGANSNYVGIDAFSVDRVLATDTFFKSNFSVYPNPANDVININKVSNLAMTSAQITDINGRVVKTVSSEVSQINISDLNAGVYMLKIVTAQGTGTTKIIKK